MKYLIVFSIFSLLNNENILISEEEFYITLKVLDVNDFNGHKRSSSGDTHLIYTNDTFDTSLKRSRSSTNITDIRYFLMFVCLFYI